MTAVNITENVVVVTRESNVVSVDIQEVPVEVIVGTSGAELAMTGDEPLALTDPAQLGASIRAARADHQHPTEGLVKGIASSTDNAVMRWDGNGGETPQDSPVIIDDDGAVTGVDSIAMNASVVGTAPAAEGGIYWDADQHTLTIVSGLGTHILQVGREVAPLFVNKTGAQINDGACVYISGAQGNRPTIALADADAKLTSDTVIGVVTADIADNQEGPVTLIGEVNGYDTSGFSAGDKLYVSSTPGELTNVPPVWPAHANHVAYAANSTVNGRIFVTVNVGQDLDEIHDVVLSGAASGDILRLESDGSWRNTPLLTESKEPTGFVGTNTTSTISLDDGTRTVSIAPLSTEFVFYVNGNRYAKTAQVDIVFPDTEGAHYFVFDSDGNIQTRHISSFASISELIQYIIFDNAYFAEVYWDATNNRGFLADERHGCVMSADTHRNLHLGDGTRYISGGALGDILADESGALDSHAEFSCEAASLLDEDIALTVAQKLATGNIKRFYKEGATGTWRWVEDSAGVVTTGTGRAAWNEFTGGAWQLTEVANNGYVLAHVYLTNAGEPIVIIGQVDYATIGQARTGAPDEVAGLQLFGLPSPEFVYVGNMIYQTSNGYTNTWKSRIRTNADDEDWADFRFSKITSGATATDHGALGGLSDDDHLQYLLLSNARGVQTITSPLSFAPGTGAQVDLDDGGTGIVDLAGSDGAQDYFTLRWDLSLGNPDNLFQFRYYDGISAQAVSAEYDQNGDWSFKAGIAVTDRMDANGGIQLDGDPITDTTGTVDIDDNVSVTGTVTATGQVQGTIIRSANTGATANSLHYANNGTQIWHWGLRGDSSQVYAIVDESGAAFRLTIDTAGLVRIFQSLQVDSNLTITSGVFKRAQSTLAAAPTGSEGAQIFITNGRKPGEGAGSGTGVPATYTNSNWYSDFDGAAVTV